MDITVVPPTSHWTVVVNGNPLLAGFDTRETADLLADALRVVTLDTWCRLGSFFNLVNFMNDGRPFTTQDVESVLSQVRTDVQETAR